MNAAILISLLGALGVGTAFGNYLGGGRARREVRSAVLNGLAACETSRYNSGPPSFYDTKREFETAALIARVPRLAVQHYLLLAATARALSAEDYEEKGGDEELGAGAIDPHFDRVVRESADIVTSLAWRPWWSRAFYQFELRKSRSRAAAIKGPAVRRQLAYSQNSLGRAPGPLGDLFDEYFPS